jgi:phenylalanyl-tRNA synthetase beta subunit
MSLKVPSWRPDISNKRVDVVEELVRITGLRSNQNYRT